MGWERVVGADGVGVGEQLGLRGAPDCFSSSYQGLISDPTVTNSLSPAKRGPPRSLGQGAPDKKPRSTLGSLLHAECQALPQAYRFTISSLINS